MDRSDLKILFQQISVGDVAAYEKVFIDWYDRVYTTALVYNKSREHAREVTQQVFLTLWERRHLLAEVVEPAAWLQTAARYRMLSLLKKQLSRVEWQLEMEAEIKIDQWADPESMFLLKEQQDAISAAIDRLPLRQQEVFRYCREQGLSYAEIAGKLGLSRETVKDHMAKALKTLREVLMKDKDAFIVLLTSVGHFFFR